MTKASAGRTPWPMSTVGAHFEIQLGKMLDLARNVGAPKPYLGNKAVQWGRIDLASAGTVLLTKEDQVRYRLRRNDLLVCEGGEVGRAAIWQEQLPECYYQKALHRLRPTSGFDPRIMMALLKYWSETGQFRNFVTQTSIAHLPRDKFLCMPLPEISPAEQKHIADVLEKTENLILCLEGLIEKKRQIKQALMDELLSGRSRLPGFNGHWVQKTLGEIANVTMGHSPPASSYNTDGSGMPLVQGNADIRHRRTVDRLWTTRPTTTCDAGEVLMTVRAPVGSVGVATRDSCLGRGVCALRALGDQRFLFHLLVHGERRWEMYGQGSTFTAVNAPQIRRLALRLPPDKVEQEAVGRLLDEAEAEIEMLGKRLRKTNALLRGIRQELLSGRTKFTVEGAAKT